MVKKIANLVLCAMALLMGQKAFANDYCDPCYSECKDFSFAISADYLYWKICRPQDSAIQASLLVAFMQPTYHSGYRVAAAAYCNCVDFEARYTSFNTQDDLLSPSTLGVIPQAAIHYHLNYKIVDLAFGYTHSFYCHRAYLKPYVGAKLAWLHDKTILDSVTTPAIRTAGLQSKAFGPMLGIEGNWELFRCWIPISLIARGDISILRNKSTFSGVTTLNNTAAAINRAHSFISVGDIYLGLSFDFCSFFCFDANLQIGYEAQIWNTSFIYSNQVLARDAPSNFGLGGLVVHLGVMF